MLLLVYLHNGTALAKQQMSVQSYTDMAKHILISNGVQHGGILSLFLFRDYIHDLIAQVTALNLNCHYAGIIIILA